MYLIFFWIRSCWKPLQASGHLLNSLLLTYTFLIHIQTKQGLLLNILQQTPWIYSEWVVSYNHQANFLLSLSFFYVTLNKLSTKLRLEIKFTGCTCTYLKGMQINDGLLRMIFNKWFLILLNHISVSHSL